MSPMPAKAQPETAEAETMGRIQIDTRFGLIEFDPANAIEMPRGLPGFAEARRFGLGPLPGARTGQFLLLQSLDDPNLAFIVLPLGDGQDLIAKEDIDETAKALGIPEEGRAVLVIVTVRDEFGERQISVNLRAPVFVDTARQQAWQSVLLNGAYPVRHLLARSRPQGSAA